MRRSTRISARVASALPKTSRPRRRKRAGVPVRKTSGKRRRKKNAPVREPILSIAGKIGKKMGDPEVISAATSLARNSRDANGLLLLDLGKENLVHATMICRPSKRNRSPYVADVRLDDGREAIAHVPCLDMGGKCVHGAKLLLKLARDKKGVPVGSNALGPYGTPKCEFITQLLWNDEPKYKTWVAAHPSLGEKLSEAIVASNIAFEKNSLIEVQSYQREVRNVCGTNMRTDFVLTHADGKRSVMEVKTVVDTDISASDAQKILKKFAKRPGLKSKKKSAPRKNDDEKKTKKKSKGHPVLFTSSKEPYVRAGIFPWGSCKQIGPDGEKVVSARAIKHVDELAKIARGEMLDEERNRLGAFVMFIVGRKDTEYFRPNHEGCPSFTRHLFDAKRSGVGIVAHRIIWGEGEDVGKAFWGGLLPVEI